MKCFEPLRISSLSLLFCIGVLAAPIQIDLHDAARKDVLHIKDIANVKTSKKPLADFVASLFIPKEFGADAVVSKDEVAEILRQNAIDTSGVKITGKARLYHPKSTLNREDVEKEIRDFLALHFPKYWIKRLSFSFEPLKLRSGRYRIALSPTSKNFTHIYLKADIYDADRKVRSFKATAYASYEDRCAVSARDIPKGRIVQMEDIVLKPVTIRSSAQECLKPDILIGAVAKRDIKQGKVFKRYYIEPDYLVKKRHSVKIVYEKGPIHIELLGLALQSGNKGEIIKVKNLSSNKVLRCEVISNGTVRFVY